jgi:phosphoribosyl 1,2-cyclic phosphodiesterase
MPRFCVLASGSSGNAAFLEVNGFGLLIDLGLNPRLLASRLASVGLSWRNVNAALLTHVHTDHWKDRTLAHLRTHGVPIYCHAGHHEALGYSGTSFRPLLDAGLVRTFEPDQPFELPAGLTCLPVAVPHDSEPTFAFRIDGPPDLFGRSWSLGYASDLGTTPERLLEAFCDVSALAIEFNHDEEMERRSGRPRHLIARVLGDRGHLSNRQAADSVRKIVGSSGRGCLRHLVQLHLSRHCNRPELAQTEAKRAIREFDRSVALTTATQDLATKMIALEADLSR